MIIECQTCHARFRLDESRIKGRGARVKCRKCGDSIVVLKDGASGSPASGGNGFFDLGSAVRESAGENRDVPPAVGNLIPFPAPPRQTEPGSKEPSPRILNVSKPEKDEVDLAFDRVLSADAESEAAPAIPGPRPELDLGALTLDFAPEGKLDLAPAVVEPSAEFRGEEGFLISDSDTLDFLQEKRIETKPESPPEIGDISLEISSAPVEEKNIFLREPDVSAPAFNDWKSPSPPRESASPTSEEIPLEGNDTPQAASVIEIPPYREAESPPAPSVESAVHRASTAPESPRPRSSAGPAVAVILAVLLVAGGYLGFTTSGRKTLERAFPGVSALWGGKSVDKVASAYNVKNLIAYYDSGAHSKRIFIIKGQVTNASLAPKSGIRVLAALMDSSDKVLMEKTVYAGNTLPGDMLKTAKSETLDKELANRFGDRLSNMDVSPGKTIPFMVVFFDAPESLDRYTVEAKDSE